MKHTLKTIAFMLAFLFLAGTVAKAQGSKLLDKYDDRDGVMTLNVSGNMFNSNMVDEIETEGVKDLLKKVGTIRLMIVEDALTSKTAADDIRRDVRSLFKSGGYKELIKVKSDGDHIDFRFKSAGKNKGELLMFIDSADSLVSVFIEGSFSANDAKELAREIRNNKDIDLGF